nr:metallophosphoesterase family protein [Candidatus Sigynarchaeota archaeon]
MRKYDSEIPGFLLDIIKDHVAVAEGRTTFVPTFELLYNIESLLRARWETIPHLLIAGDAFNDVIIAGDTHGDLHSTAKIIAPFLEGKVDSLIFLGDYVDRGEHSLMNLLLVISLSLAWPGRVIILRGNHEDVEINGIYGFRHE